MLHRSIEFGGSPVPLPVATIISPLWTMYSLAQACIYNLLKFPRRTNERYRTIKSQYLHIIKSLLFICSWIYQSIQTFMGIDIRSLLKAILAISIGHLVNKYSNSATNPAVIIRSVRLLNFISNHQKRWKETLSLLSLYLLFSLVTLECAWAKQY